MRTLNIFIIAVIAFCLSACKDPGDKVDPVTTSLVDALNVELAPLSQDPSQWTDSQMEFLDAYSEKDIIGLGEGTHGTSEFFKAKHRMLKYLVEKHGFKIFSIEADFGESYLINQAVMNSDKSQIVSLMKDKMIFWVWKTNEVRDMLLWMCDYNVGKEDAEKVQYWGIDCQYNTYNPTILIDKLTAADVPFISFAKDVLDNATTASKNNFSGLNATDFGHYIGKLSDLTDSLTKRHEYIASKTSEDEYQLIIHFMDVIVQSSNEIYNVTNNFTLPRDKNMATNVMWLREHLKKKVVVWAHDGHIENFPGPLSNPLNGSMGSFITATYGNDYVKIGQVFSKGTFRAVTFLNNTAGAVEIQSLTEDPQAGTLNDMMFRAKETVFTVSVSQLLNHQEWHDALTDQSKGMTYLSIGSTYDNEPKNHYVYLSSTMYDQIIYFNSATNSVTVSN
jgi:erythromycin esterase